MTDIWSVLLPDVRSAEGYILQRMSAARQSLGLVANVNSSIIAAKSSSKANDRRVKDEFHSGRTFALTRRAGRR